MIYSQKNTSIHIIKPLFLAFFVRARFSHVNNLFTQCKPITRILATSFFIVSFPRVGFQKSHKEFTKNTRGGPVFRIDRERKLEQLGNLGVSKIDYLPQWHSIVYDH